MSAQAILQDGRRNTKEDDEVELRGRAWEQGSRGGRGGEAEACAHRKRSPGPGVRGELLHAPGEGYGELGRGGREAHEDVEGRGEEGVIGGGPGERTGEGREEGTARAARETRTAQLCSGGAWIC